MKSKHILFLHGAIGAKDQLEPLAELLRNDYDISLLNFSGHGGSEAPGEPFSIEMFASDVIDFIELKGLESTDIFGYSMGGYVGMYLAKYYPDKVRKLFTFATKYEWSPATAARETAMLNPAKIEAKVPKFAEALMKRHGENNWRKVLEKTAEMMIGLGNENVLKEKDLESIEQKVLAGVGDKDNMVTIDETVTAFRKLSNGRLLVMQDTPHPVEKISASRLAEEIRIFFE